MRGFKKGKDNPIHDRDTTGSNNPRWKGGRIKCGDRTMIKKPEHHRANCRGYVYEYVLIAEEKIGRSLHTDEIIHHINGNSNDNRPENLEVTTQKAHTENHKRKDHSLRECKWCGSDGSESEEILPTGYMTQHWYIVDGGDICRRCYHRYRYHERKA